MRVDGCLAQPPPDVWRAGRVARRAGRAGLGGQGGEAGGETFSVCRVDCWPARRSDTTCEAEFDARWQPLSAISGSTTTLHDCFGGGSARGPRDCRPCTICIASYLGGTLKRPCEMDGNEFNPSSDALVDVPDEEAGSGQSGKSSHSPIDLSAGVYSSLGYSPARSMT